MKKLALNVKNMKEALVNYSDCQSEFNKTWEMFYDMKAMGFISDDEWHRFFSECHGWYFDEENMQVKDMGDCDGKDKVIWTCNPDTQYRA